MTKLDEFESLFNSASKPVFHIEPIQIKNVLIVADLELDMVTDFIQKTESFLQVLNSTDYQIDIKHIGGDQFGHVQQLLDLAKGHSADLICTYRNLHCSASDYPFSLGEYVDVLTQASSTPILLLPRPEDFTETTMVNTDRVMLMTDHLAGDSQLVTYGALFTQDHGELIMAHVEDEQTFERYIQVISKIPSIDTPSAREEIMEQLLKEPRDYIESCKLGLKEAGLPITVKPVVAVGHHLTDYKKLIQENETDLLVIHTKDEDQQAMHGLAYPVSVEFRDVPLLLI